MCLVCFRKSHRELTSAVTLEFSKTFVLFSHYKHVFPTGVCNSCVKVSHKNDMKIDYPKIALELTKIHEENALSDACDCAYICAVSKAKRRDSVDMSHIPIEGSNENVEVPRDKRVRCADCGHEMVISELINHECGRYFKKEKIQNVSTLLSQESQERFFCV